MSTDPSLGSSKNKRLYTHDGHVQLSAGSNQLVTSVVIKAKERSAAASTCAAVAVFTACCPGDPVLAKPELAITDGEVEDVEGFGEEVETTPRELRATTDEAVATFCRAVEDTCHVCCDLLYLPRQTLVKKKSEVEARELLGHTRRDLAKVLTGGASPGLAPS